MSTHYAEAEAFVAEALQELDPQPDEQRRSMDAARVHATLALVDVLAAWRADIHSVPQPLQFGGGADEDVRTAHYVEFAEAVRQAAKP